MTRSMNDISNPVGDNYVLETGDRGAARLQLLHDVYWPSAEEVCRTSGLAEGWRVADIGCGTGNVTCWFGKQVGTHGQVTAVDVSDAQLAIARQRAENSRSVFSDGIGNATTEITFKRDSSGVCPAIRTSP